MKVEQLQFKRAIALPMILQDERAECGLACVAMISNYFGHQVDLRWIRTSYHSSALGLNLLHLKNIFEALGLNSRALSVPLSELHLVKTPAIMHWNMNHFVVLKKVKKKSIIIHDPAIGVRQVRMEDVSIAFTGVILEVEPSHDFKKLCGYDRLTLHGLVKTVKGIGIFLCMLLMLSLFIESLVLINPLLMQYITDNVIASGDKNNLYLIAFAFVALLGLHVFLEFIRGNLLIYLNNNLIEQFSSNILHHLLRLPISFFERRFKGDLQSKFHSIDQIQKKMGADFVRVVLDGLFVLLNCSVMLVYSPLLTGLVCSSLFFVSLSRYLSYSFSKKQSESSMAQHAQAASIFLENLQAIIPIKSFLKEGIRFNAWKNAYVRALNADIAISKTQALYQCISQLIFQGELILVACCGASLVLSSQLSLGMLIAFLSYRLLFVNKTASLIQNIFDYQLLSIQLNRLADILFTTPELLQRKEDTLNPVRGCLRLKDVSFQYDKQSHFILNKINMDIKAGEKIVIVGPSGCGKSTLIKVMMGLLQQTEGRIYLDEYPIDEFGLKNYRELTASVMQDDTLLSGSILNNIAFFDEEIHLERVYEAAQLASIHDTIKALPMGYDTLVGDMGSSLSGGQRQRVLLARALYKQPKLLFLDEASSHLDKANELKINQSLKALNITQIIIAHRQETIQMADRVIDLGKIE